MIAALGQQEQRVQVGRFGLLRPVSASQRPIGSATAPGGTAVHRPAELGLDLRELLEPLLERRVGRGQRLRPTPLIAGAMKNAFIALAARRSCCGIAATCRR